MNEYDLQLPDRSCSRTSILALLATRMIDTDQPVTSSSCSIRCSSASHASSAEVVSQTLPSVLIASRVSLSQIAYVPPISVRVTVGGDVEVRV